MLNCHHNLATRSWTNGHERKDALKEFRSHVVHFFGRGCKEVHVLFLCEMNICTMVQIQIQTLPRNFGHGRGLRQTQWGRCATMDARFELLRPLTEADEGGQIYAAADRCAATGGGDSTGATRKAKATYMMPGQRIKAATDEPHRSTDTGDSKSANGVKPMYRLPGKQRRVRKRGAVNVEADDHVDEDDEAVAEMLREQEQEQARRLIEKHRQKLSEARRAAMEAAEATRLAEQQRMVELLRKQKTSLNDLSRRVPAARPSETLMSQQSQAGDLCRDMRLELGSQLLDFIGGSIDEATTKARTRNLSPEFLKRGLATTLAKAATRSLYEERSLKEPWTTGTKQAPLLWSPNGTPGKSQSSCRRDRNIQCLRTAICQPPLN